MCLYEMDTITTELIVSSLLSGLAQVQDLAVQLLRCKYA